MVTNRWTSSGPMRSEDALTRAVIAAGEPWMGVVERGQYFRILDLEGNQAVDTMFYSARHPAERYSAVDTIQAQRNLYLSTGHGHIGWTMSMGSARIVADIIGGRKPEIDLAGLTLADA